MLLARQACLTALIFSLLTGCAQAVTDSQFRYLPDEVSISSSADEIYAYFRLDRAMRNDDLRTVMDAATTLLPYAGSEGPLIEAAAWLLNNRYFDQAGELLQAAVLAKPDELALHVMLAETMLNDNKFDQAIELMVDFLVVHQDQSDGFVELALLYLQAEQYENALAVFEKLPEEQRNPGIHYYQSQAYRLLGNLPQAAAMLRLALEQAPDFVEAQLELALVLEELGEYAESAQLFENLLVFDTENQDILLRLLTVALKAGDPERAFEIASGMLDSQAFMLAAASVFMHEDRYDLAEQLLDLAAANTAFSPEIVFYQAAVAYEGKHDSQAALDLLDKIGPDHRYWDRAVRLRIQILYESGAYDQALEMAQTSSSSFPSEYEYNYLLMELYQAAGLPEQALSLSYSMLADYPDDPILAFNHAYILDRLGNKTEALAFMEQALEQFPDFAPLLNYVGYTLAVENRDLQRSLQLLEKAVQLAPNEAYIVDSLAWVHFRLGNFDQAWLLIQQALELAGEYPSDAEMWDHYGDIAYALEKFNEARIGWAMAVSLNPDNITEIQAKLEQL